MADDIIGSLGIQIEADASDLPGQYDAAVAASESAAERIASAFESVVGIGEALAITEGLKEFGQEALTAYGTVQSVTIGLTQLTKSASDANEIIGQIKELAATEPFAFPEIAPTVQKMVALGVSAEQIPGVMQAAADAAAATGNSFQAVAASIDRMSLSGTVSARSLVQLGVSTEDLGRVMGVTAEEVKKAFAALDQEERINVLTEALNKFAGSAEAQAKGIAGEWQIFKNQFEEVMVSVGEAIAPTAKLLITFGTDALSIVQPLVEAFNKIPEPLRQVGEVAGLAFLAMGPLAKALEAVGLFAGEAAISQAAETIATEAQGAAAATTAEELGALELAETGVGEAAGAAAITTGAAGEAAAGAGIGITAMGAAATAAGAALAIFVGYEIGKWAQDNIPGLVELERHLIDFATKYLPNFGDALDHVKQQFNLNGEASKSEAEEILSLQSQLREAGVVLQQFGDDNEHFIGVLRDVRQQIADTGKEVKEGYGSSVDELIAKQAKLNEAEQQAKANLLQVQQAYKDHAVSIDVLNAAYADYTKALDAANASNVNFKDSFAGISEEYGKQQAKIATLQGAVMGLIAAQDGSVDMANKLAIAEGKLSSAYDGIATAAKKAADNTIAFVGPLTEEEEATRKAAGQLDAYGTAAEALVQKQRDLQLSVQNAKGTLDALTASTDTSTAHTQATIVALIAYQTALKATGGDMDAVTTITINGVTQIGKLSDIIKKAKDNAADFHSTMVNVPQVITGVGEAADGTLKRFDSLTTGQRDNVNVITTQAIPAYQSFADSHGQLATAANGAQSSLAKINAETQKSLDVSGRAAGSNSTLKNSYTDLGNGVVSSANSQAAAFGQLDDGFISVNNNAALLANGMASLDDEAAASAAVADHAAQSWNDFSDAVGSALDAIGNGGQGGSGGGGTITAPGADPKVGDIRNLTSTPGTQYGITLNTWTQALIDNLHANEAATKQMQQYSQQLIDAGVATSNVGAVMQDLANKSSQTGISLSKEISDYISNMGKVASATTSTATATTTLANATTGNATALGTKATATSTASAATNALTTATTSLSTAAGAAADAIQQYNGLLNNSSVTTTDALGNVTTAYTTTAQAAQQFVDGLGNVYNSYQALVDAIKANPLLAGPAQSQSGSGNPGSGPSAAPGQQYVDGMGNIYSSLSALQQALAANPGLAGPHVQSGALQTVTPASGGNSTNYTIGGVAVSQAQYEASLRGGGASFTNPYNYTPTTPGTSPGFGSSPAGGGGSGVTVVMNYPQFNSQQQSQQVINQVVAQLRTVVGQKI